MHLGRILGVRVRIHWLFLALLALAALAGAAAETAILLGGLLTHELAHLLVARANGLRVEEIELYPFGGVARVTADLDQDPYATALTAAAGPLNNFIWLAIGVGLQGTAWFQPTRLEFFNQVNLTLALFNLLPAIPLDGGRVYRTYLTRQHGYVPATRRLAGLGRIAAALLLGLGIVGAMSGHVYIGAFVLPVFLYLSAAREEAQAMFAPWRGLLRAGDELRRQRVLPAGQVVMLEDAPLRDALSLLGAGKYHLITVLDAGLRPIGTLTEAELLEGLGADSGLTAGELVRRLRRS